MNRGAMRPLVRTLGDQVYEALRRDIIDLKLRPGEVLVEQELADRYGVSKTPVRAALTRLSREGFVVSEAHKGSRVAPTDPAIIRQQFQMKVALEGFALGQVAASLVEADLAALRAILMTSERAMASQDYSMWIESNNRFHCFFIEKLQNQLMLEAIKNLYAHLQRARMIFFRHRARDDWELMHTYHQRILEAVERKDVSTAQALLYEHTERFLMGLDGAELTWHKEA